MENSSASEVAHALQQGPQAATRQRILEVAGRRFNEDGIAGAGVAAVMTDADLTNGATPTSRPRRTSSRTCSPTGCAPNAKASTPSPRIGRDSKRSSAPPVAERSRSGTGSHPPDCSGTMLVWLSARAWIDQRCPSGT